MRYMYLNKEFKRELEKQFICGWLWGCGTTFVCSLIAIYYVTH